jgi:hypothetical protein
MGIPRPDGDFVAPGKKAKELSVRARRKVQIVSFPLFYFCPVELTNKPNLWEKKEKETRETIFNPH